MKTTPQPLVGARPLRARIASVSVALWVVSFVLALPTDVRGEVLTAPSFPPASLAPGSLDLTFDPTAGGEALGLTGGRPRVEAVVRQPDGKILIGGWFNGVHGRPRNNIARLNSDGTLDESFDPGLGADGAIHSLALQMDGRILAGGEFRTMDGRPRRIIARLNPDGSLDQNFNSMSWTRALPMSR
jgi:uncharacterized delta-60 repeat protein